MYNNMDNLKIRIENIETRIEKLTQEIYNKDKLIENIDLMLKDIDDGVNQIISGYYQSRFVEKGAKVATLRSSKSALRNLREEISHEKTALGYTLYDAEEELKRFLRIKELEEKYPEEPLVEVTNTITKKKRWGK